MVGDSEMLRRIERAMAGEKATAAKRRATTAAMRQAVGGARTSDLRHRI